MIVLKKTKGWINLEKKLRDRNTLKGKVEKILKKYKKIILLIALEHLKETIKKGRKLDRLADVTVKIKIKKRMPNPKSPLYGLGEDDPKSMMNGLVFKALGPGGYRIVPEGKHYSGADQKMLWAVHEYGAVVKVTEKMRWFWLFEFGIPLKKTTAVIKIPKREPFAKAAESLPNNKEYKEAVRNMIAEIKDVVGFSK